MKRRYALGLAIVLAGCSLVPALAHAQIEAGVMVWRHTTGLDVLHVTDFDGGDETGEEKAKDWDIKGSGMGLRFGYRFPAIAAIFGELGAGQVTVRAEDLTDPNLDLRSHGFDEGVYAAFGGRVSNEFPQNARVFWAGGFIIRFLTTEVDEDITTTWDYDETMFSIDAKLGYWFQAFGLYGGLRFADHKVNLEETDTTRLPFEQVRRIELERDSPADILLGGRIRSGPVFGFVEMGIVGTFSTATGVSVHF